MELLESVKLVYTKQDYGPKPKIEGVRFIDLDQSTDDGGFFSELGHLDKGHLRGVKDFVVRQINYSAIEPNVIKAYHLHETQTDVWYVPPTDRLLMVLIDVRPSSPTPHMRMRFLLGYGKSRLVVIPPGVAHGCRNLSKDPGRILYFVDSHFNPDPEWCEEGRLPWDFAGSSIWEVNRG